MYIWTYIILLTSKREHTFPLQLYSSRYRYSVRLISLKGRINKHTIYLLSFIYIYVHMDSLILSLHAIWKDENIDLFIEFLYTYIWTYIILAWTHVSIIIIFVQISIQRSSNIFEGMKRTIWKDENVDLFIKYLYMY